MKTGTDAPVCARCGGRLNAEGWCLPCLARGQSHAAAAPSSPPAAHAQAAAPPEIPGYEVLDLLGHGGMGAVWKARQQDTGEVVALKVLHRALSGQQRAVERFEHEVDLLATLDHPNVVRLLDAGETGDGALFFATEHVEGCDLRRLLRAERLPPERALAIFGRVCDALRHAHGRGVLHRDLKPANILVGADGTVKVADFGLGKALQPTNSPLVTQAQDAFGTPYYVAPESVVDASSADERADVYGLGVLLYEMLTGKVPQGAFSDVSAACGLSRRWDALLRAALKDDRGQRLPDVASFQHAAERLWQREQRLGTWKKRRAWLVAAAAAVVAGVGGAWWGRGLDRPPAPPTHPPPSSATREQPWKNSLGMAFVPLPDTLALMCVHETRVRDFQRYYDSDMVASMPWLGDADSGERRAVTTLRSLTPEGWASFPEADYDHPGFDVTPDHPAVGIWAFDAYLFTHWLTWTERRDGRIGPEDRYRLPNYAEWKIATRDEGTERPAGNFAGPEAADANWPPARATDTVADLFPRTAPVMSFPPNALGLYDIAGNVSECLVSRPMVDRQGRRGDVRLAVIGGSWADPAGGWNELVRQGIRPSLRRADIGFRLVLELAP